MKLHCHRTSLMAAFQVVNAVVPSRTPREILKNIKLELDGGTATLIGTDQEVGIRYEIQGVESSDSGEILLPAARVISILRELTEDSVDLELDENGLWIRSGQSEFRLSAEEPDEFPPVSSFLNDNFYAIPASAMREVIRRTIFATDVESTRYALGGILVELSEDSVTLAATDSRRLAVAKTSCRLEGEHDSSNCRPVIPAKAMSLIDKSIIDEDDEVYISIQANDILVKSGPATIYSRIIEGRFPNYQDVIPASPSTTIDMVVGPFYAAVRQAQIVTNEESRGVDFKFSNGNLCMTSEAADVGRSKIEIPISYEGDEITITFDPRFVGDFLKILEAESSIQVELTDGESAAVLKKDDSYTYVVMPLSRDR